MTPYKILSDKKIPKFRTGQGPIRILVTAGPTQEPIDPVRFISNYSTGTMGYAIAKIAKKRGHHVSLISGPTHLKQPRGVKTISITTAEEMFKAVKSHLGKSDCLVMSAAVSDFRPARYYKKKQKRAGRLKAIPLRENTDILLWAGRKKDKRVLVGFCMETENLLLNARKKLHAKSLDMIVANEIDTKKSAFGAGKTSVLILGPDKEKTSLADIPKEKIAGILLDKIERLWYKK